MSNTIVLSEDTSEANLQLEGLLVNPAAAVYLFIFGTTAAITLFASDADGVANGALRRVVTRSQYADILDRFTVLQIAAGLSPLTSPDLVGFSTSGHIVIADVVLSDDFLDALRASDAFMRAEAQA